MLPQTVGADGFACFYTKSNMMAVLLCALKASARSRILKVWKKNREREPIEGGCGSLSWCS